MDDIGVLFFSLHDFLMQTFYSGIEDLVFDGELGELLIEEADVGLIL